MKFQTDFASHEYLYIFRFQLTLLAVTFLLVLLAAWNFENYRATFPELDKVADSVKRVKEQSTQQQSKLQSGGKTMTPEQAASLPKDIAFANELLQRKTFYWSNLLSDIETVIPGNISITRIQLNSKEQRVMMSGFAVSLKDLTQFIIRLEDSSAFENVFLDNQKTAEHDWVGFSLSADYHIRHPPEKTKK